METFHEIVSVRVAHVVLIPFTLLGNLCHLGAGLCCAVVALLTAGYCPSVTNVASEQLRLSFCLLSDAYVHLLCAVKPNAAFNSPGQPSDESNDLNDFLKEPFDSSTAGLALPSGIIRYHYIISISENNPLQNMQDACAHRATIVKILACLILANLADCSIACIVVPVSFILLGSSSSVNGLAYHTVGAPIALVYDIWLCSICLCNPKARKS